MELQLQRPPTAANFKDGNAFGYNYPSGQNHASIVMILYFITNLLLSIIALFQWFFFRISTFSCVMWGFTCVRNAISHQGTRLCTDIHLFTQTYGWLRGENFFVGILVGYRRIPHGQSNFSISIPSI